MSVVKLNLPGRARNEVRRVLGLGWRLEHGGKHLKLHHPTNGKFVTIPKSPSSGHIETLVPAWIRRIERAA
jgi:hypothetical protein